MAKLNEREKIGSLILDEIYIAKRCEYSRSTGQIYGMESNEIEKMLLTVMFKSVAAQYQDVIAMVPVVKISSSMLYGLFNRVMSSTTAIGYDAVVSLVDGHSANAKFYKSELCCDKPTSFIAHPLDENKKLFPLFDSVHIFKCL